MDDHIRWFRSLRSSDVAVVGGKNASLGEMFTQLTDAGIRVPDGFATTATTYWEFVDANDLRDVIVEQIDRLHDGAPLAEVGGTLRERFLAAEVPVELSDAIAEAYEQLGGVEPAVAVRSSATAEDLPEASFAGQQESFLNVSGTDAVLDTWRRCVASLFTDRAINYREDRDFDHRLVALSVGIQRMVRSDRAGAGVMFTVDTESGFPDVIVINAAWGLGESVVSGAVDPDEYVVFTPMLSDHSLCPIIHRRVGAKASKIIYADDSTPAGTTTRTVDSDLDESRSVVLSDHEILDLARWGRVIEQHYETPMDIEWAKDGDSGEIFVVQARPETTGERHRGSSLRSYRLTESGDALISGLAIGDSIASGPVCRLDSPDEISDFVDGAVLVTEITDPDWEPIMTRAAAIVTDRGGRTSHAAIVSRELGVTAVIGATGATETLGDGREVTVSCAEGDRGVVYDGVLEHEVAEIELDEIPSTRTDVMLNMAQPAGALRWWRLPAAGVGLTRIEFIVSSHIKVHPMALVHFDDLEGADREHVERLTVGYEDDRPGYFVDRLSQGVARIAASQWPRPVIVRMSDFKTNEYARLVGGSTFEPDEENPMLGWRGASRYYSDGYREGFALECRAMHRVRDEMGLTNVVLMIPFCRSPQEADRVLEELAEHGLVRGRNGLEIYVMAEIPSNVILAEEFARRFDGFSIGSNDLTQLTLGVDRDSGLLAHLFDENDPAVTSSIEHLVDAAHRNGVKVGLCGQRPSDDPDFAAFLVRSGIDSISVVPDSFLQVVQHVAEAEAATDR